MNTITLRLENGTELSAPIGIWLAGLLAILPEAQQAAIKEKVGQMMTQPHLIAAHHHTLDAEPLILNLKGKGHGRIQ